MIHKVINFDNFKVHYANARREDLAKTLPPEDVTPEDWWHWRTVCGKELIGRTRPDEPVTCTSCLRAYAAAEKTAARLAARFG